jgi:UDP-2,3-diacylglucosamine pyrophosphatase LpxH
MAGLVPAIHDFFGRRGTVCRSSSVCDANRARRCRVTYDSGTDEDPQSRFVRTIFLSDVHLGTRGCKADLLLDFLKHHDADTLYLVGDIIDGWRLKAGWYWPQAQNDVVQKLLRKVRKGTRLVYVPGNHDEFLRDYVGHNFGGIELAETAIHHGADGRRYLVIHGDHFDLVVRNAKWLALLGDWAYEAALVVNTHFNTVRRRLGFPYWSLSAWAKLRVKNAVNFIGRFEEILAAEAHRHEADGVICGHIHHAALRDLAGVRYINTGDWVESCTAVIEHHDGRFEIVRWVDDVERKLATGQPAAASLPAPLEEVA